MSELLGLDDGFGDRNTFALTLLGLRRLLDQAAALLSASDTTTESETDTVLDTAANIGASDTAVGTEPTDFDHVLLGLLAIKGVLDEICGELADLEPRQPASLLLSPAEGRLASEDVRGLLR